MRQPDAFLVDAWHPVATRFDPARPERSRLLGQPIEVRHSAQGPEVRRLNPDGSAGALLPVQMRYECLWTTLGTPGQDIFDIAEAAEPDRQTIACGWITLHTSAPRMIENFLDMAHFPFVHPEILGTEDHPEVPEYQFEIRRDVDEVWASNCRFFNKRWDTSATGADQMDRSYRVPAPFAVVLYRKSRHDPARKDVLAAFVHPVEETQCQVQVVTWLADQGSAPLDLMVFEQIIFAQDRIIVENQRPLRLPLEAGAEIPTRADGSSIAYRRWLKEKGLVWATTRC